MYCGSMPPVKKKKSTRLPLQLPLQPVENGKARSGRTRCPSQVLDIQVTWHLGEALMLHREHSQPHHLANTNVVGLFAAPGR